MDMTNWNRKNWKKQITVDGIKFIVGYKIDCEFTGPIFMIGRNSKWYGALSVAFGHETKLGFNSGLFATENEISAAKKAFEIMKSTEI